MKPTCRITAWTILRLSMGVVVMKKQHSTANFAAPFLHNDRTQSFSDWCIIRTIDRGSTWQLFGEQNTIVYPRKWSSSSFQLIFLSGVELVFVHLASSRPWLPTGWEDRSGESRTHRRLRCNQKTWSDLLRSVAGALHNNPHERDVELVSTISVATVCKPSSCLIDCPSSHGGWFLEWAILQLGDGQRLFNYALRFVVGLRCFVV